MKPLANNIISVNSFAIFFTFFLLSAGCSEEKHTPGDVQGEDWTDTLVDTQDQVGEDGAPCVPTEEQCNGIDDDCDGEIDNGFDLLFDSENCGACGWVCDLDNATARCENGACWVDTCMEGYYDANGDPSDGCEYLCTMMSTEESQDDGSCSDGIDNDCDGRIDEDDPDCSDCVPEYCDSIDNDCDGLIDEDFDLRSDPDHCGNCSTVCPDYPRAFGVCVLGSCDINCEAGYTDLDGIILNGCEATCLPDADPNESLCDGVDNDCDGLMDEDYVPYSCGVGACMVNSICWDGMESCVPTDPEMTEDTVCNNVDEDCDSMVDEDYEPTDACTGHCRTTATCVEGVEVCGDPLPGDGTCDGVDDDCDGVTDDDYTPYTCGSGACTRQSTCIGGVEQCDEGAPTTEVCNDSDDDCDGHIDNGDISTLCPSTPPHATPACVDGSCVIGSCSSGWYDVDGQYTTGCECQQETTESSSTACGSPRNLGTLSDSGSGASQSVSGNIVPAGDSDWYTFTATDTSESSPGCDNFYVDVRFTSNPGNSFRMDVYRNSCSDSSPCLNEASTYDWYADYRTGSGTSARGECPCNDADVPNANTCNVSTINASTGLPQNVSTSTYFVRVYRAAGATLTCDSYTIQVSNGLYSH
jgi:Notch-like protein